MEQNSAPPPRRFSWQRLRADAVIYRTTVIFLLAIMVLSPVGLIV